jgi:RNA polymerase sigma factor (sigma-70 family)
MSVRPAGEQPPVWGVNAEFERLFPEMFRRLTAAVVSLGFTVEEGKDAAETALLEVAQKWPDLDNPQAWAYMAARNAALKIRRKQGADERALRKVRGGGYQPEAHQDPGLAAVEYREWVQSLLRSLPPAQQAAAACCLIDGFTPGEAAELLGTNAVAMRARLHDARKSLRRYLAEEAAAETPASTRAGINTVPAATAGRREV